MNILHLSNTPLSNSPSNLANIQRQFGHSAQAVLHRQSNTNKIFVGGKIWTTMTQEQITAYVEEADIVHFHNFAWSQEIFKVHPHLIEIVKKKRCLIQYHSPRQGIESFEDTLNDQFFAGKRAIVAQYQVRLYPEVDFVVPNVLPIFDNLYRCLPRDFKQTMISYAPSNTNLKGWDDKGYPTIMPLLQKIGRRVPVDIIVNTPYEDTMMRKRWSTIGIEEVITGSYHLSFLEYLAFGCATIGNLDDLTKQAMAKVIGEENVRKLPYIQSDIYDLPKAIESIMYDHAAAKSLGQRARAWMETYWNPETFVKYFDSIYAKL